jgi:AcrR family transcriptional regulator
LPAIPKHRQPIVNAAVTLFRRQGYSATGLNDIVDESGAPKGSLYHYFPAGKASIAVAAVGPFVLGKVHEDSALSASHAWEVGAQRAVVATASQPGCLVQ